MQLHAITPVLRVLGIMTVIIALNLSFVLIRFRMLFALHCIDVYTCIILKASFYNHIAKYNCLLLSSLS